jgi:hypothetical protein
LQHGNQTVCWNWVLDNYCWCHGTVSHILVAGAITVRTQTLQSFAVTSQVHGSNKCMPIISTFVSKIVSTSCFLVGGVEWKWHLHPFLIIFCAMFWLHLFQKSTASRRWCCRWCDEFFHPGWRKLGPVHCVFHPDILVSIDRMFILTESPTWETFVLLRRFLNTQGQTLSFRDCQLVHTLNHLWQVLVVDFWGSGNGEVFGWYVPWHGYNGESHEKS